ncbi:MAG: glycosyltransferase family 2 protein [Gemmatales bacterium]|nr:glycosyltransferase family 2 protein [Gemmatales bacterium]MDW8386837.1 glycosyltransferase family 2 protein [Gemmatales bacterium]
MKLLTAIPVYNEERNLEAALTEVRKHVADILVVNDGSTDGTPDLLHKQKDLHVITHRHNRGYGGAIISAMAYAVAHDYDVLVTTDCDGQHEPARIPVLLEALGEDVDIASGSRYLRTFRKNTPPPEDRQRINFTITRELNERFGLHLTDAFCGFKAYRVPALRRLHLTETGWGMPLQLWVQAAYLGLRIVEVAVPLIYLDPNRAFGGVLNDPDQRLAYYREVINREALRCSLIECGQGGCL